MPSGTPVTPEQKQYIVENKDYKFVSELSKELGLNRKTIRNILNE